MSEKSDTKYTVAIYPQGKIGFGRRIMDECFAEYESAVLSTHSEFDAIGIQPIVQSAETSEVSTQDGIDGYHFTISRDRYTGRITAKRFLESQGFLPEETAKYEAEWIDDQDFLVVYLNKPVEAE